MHVTGDPEGRPPRSGFALADVLTGQQAVAAVLAALRARDRDGVGQQVDVALFDAAMAGLVNLGTGWLDAGVAPRRRGNRHPSLAPYQPYAAADGTLVLAVGSQRLWARLGEVLARPDLVDDPRFATNADRVAHVDALEVELRGRPGHPPRGGVAGGLPGGRRARGARPRRRRGLRLGGHARA